MYPEIYIDYAIRLLEAAKRQKMKARRRKKLLESDEGILAKIKNFFKNIWEKIKSFFRMIKENIVKFWNRITGKTEAELHQRLEKVQMEAEEKSKIILDQQQKIAEVESKYEESQKKNVEYEREIARLEKEKRNLVKELDKAYEAGEIYKGKTKELEDEIKTLNKRIENLRTNLSRHKDTIQDLDKRLKTEERKQAVRGSALHEIEKNFNEMKKKYENTKSIFGILEKHLTECEKKLGKDCKKAKHYLYIAQTNFNDILSDERMENLEKLLKTMFFGYEMRLQEGLFDRVGGAFKSGAITLAKIFVSFLKITGVIFLMLLAIDLMVYVAKKVRNIDFGAISKKISQMASLNPSSFNELFKYLISRIEDAAAVALFAKLFAISVIVVSKIYKKFVGRKESDSVEVEV